MALTEHEKEENVRTLAVMLYSRNPILAWDTSRRIARELIDSTDGWRPWSELSQHAKMPMVIVARDPLGFVHDATHVIGAKDLTGIGFAEEWKKVLV